MVLPTISESRLSAKRLAPSLSHWLFNHFFANVSEHFVVQNCIAEVTMPPAGLCPPCGRVRETPNGFAHNINRFGSSRNIHLAREVLIKIGTGLMAKNDCPTHKAQRGSAPVSKITFTWHRRQPLYLLHSEKTVK